MIKRNGIILFGIAMLAIYCIGFVNTAIFDKLVSRDLTRIMLSKEAFQLEEDALDFPIENRNINNRELLEKEDKTRSYKYIFNDDIFEAQLANIDEVRPNWFLVIEKPDCQYFEVQLNDALITKKGSSDGKGNLWSSTYLIEFNETALQQENSLTITMYSDYMTGVAGDIFFISSDSYDTLYIENDFTQNFVSASINIAFFTAFIVLLIVLSLRKKIYNKIGYIYFVISIFTIGIGLFDYSYLPVLPIDYLLFKKIIILSYHVAITFAFLGVSVMLNVKQKFNAGFIGTFIVIVAYFIIKDMVTFRAFYQVVNLLLILNVIHIVGILIRYRKRDPVKANILLIGFALCGITVIKLVFIGSGYLDMSINLDMPILAMIYVMICLYLIFLDFLRLSEEYALQNNVLQSKTNQILENFQQGVFTIDRKLKIFGSYSPVCHEIFQKNILGDYMYQLFFPEDTKNQTFLIETLEPIFDKNFEYKDGFITLLPNQLYRNERIFKIDYVLHNEMEVSLSIIMTDVTQLKSLESMLKHQKEESDFIINCLKRKRELIFLLEHLNNGLKRLRDFGFRDSEILELHTIKGNLGQFGFHRIEQKVHDIESLLEDALTKQGSYALIDTNQVVDELYLALEEDLSVLDQKVGRDYFVSQKEAYTITHHQIESIKAYFTLLYGESEKGDDFLQQLNQIRHISILELLSPYEEFIAKLSLELEKPVLPFDLSGMSILVDPQKIQRLISSMVSLFRNCIVHGIESAQERMNMGKDSFGLINCHVYMDEDNKGSILIKVADDGRGIDPNYVVEKALKYALITEKEALLLTESEKLELVFRSKLSFTEKVDLYSGRGVGLSSVREEVKRLGGVIGISSVLGQKTEFTLVIPMSSVT